jgi:molybdopterin/thiamine biosynthesis adenylyltransferase
MLEKDWLRANSNVLCEDKKERVTYLLGNRFKNTVVINKVIQVPDDAYISHNGVYVQIKREWVGEMVFKVALENDYDVVADMHSHPFSTKRVAFSSIDDNSDYEKLPHINEVLTKESQKFGNARSFTGIAFVVDWGSFDARILVGRCFSSIEKLTLIGNKSLGNLFPTSHSHKDITAPSFLSKQVSIFGNEGQKKISQAKVVLCGAGGIGSIVSEGLLRLGIQKLSIIDNDILEESNLHRWQGGKPKDIGKHKSLLLKKNLSQAFPNADIKNIIGAVFSESALDELFSADIIVGAIDNHVTRVFLSRLAGQYLIPFIDGAAQIVKNPSHAASPQYKTVFFIPGITGCFDCSNFPLFDKKQVALSYVDPTTYEWIKTKGYLEDAPAEKAVTVYGINLKVSGEIILQIQNYLTGGSYIWYYRSNSVEFENGFFVKHCSTDKNLSEMVPLQAVPIEHALSAPNEECPFCQGRRAGRSNAFSLTFPAMAGRNPLMPKADNY